MRIVLAGATGFIGGAIARVLEVTPLARGATPPRCDVLIWAAGNRGSDRRSHVAQAAAAMRAARPARAIYLSSGECYGNAPLPFREDGPALGTSDYARAKLAGEQAVRPAIALRLGVVYGPNQPCTMLLSHVAAALRAGSRVALTAGTQTRDFVFVDDVADAVAAAIAAVDPPPVINIASGRETTVRDACLELARILDRPAALLGFGDLAMRPDEPGRYVLDPALAATALGWHARTPLAIGLAR
ncbi:MAG: NAD(P)-dependent oxidoreductase [Kofleriaceae bacterium]